MAQEISLLNTRTDAGKIPEYKIITSNQPEDALWDAFLAKTSGGHHVQTSLWAQVKAMLGYRAARVMISRENGTIVSGAQILIRSFPLIGKVGFVSKGPLVALNHPELEERTIQELLQTARRSRIQCLIVQPPDTGDPIVPILNRCGFQPVDILLAPAATVLLDLSKDLDTILEEMKQKTRYNIRLGQRKGITVRQGTEADLSTFYQLVKETGRRQKFSTYPAEYYEKMWRLFHPQDLIHLFIASYEGEVVSALLAVAFGDTVIYKMGGWSGRHGKFRPNEVMHWAAIEWAKSKGYRYYDFEGVNAQEAQELVENKEPVEPHERTVTSFKLGFGGQLTFFPGAYLYITSPILRPIYNLLSSKTAGFRMLKKVARYIRTR